MAAAAAAALVVDAAAAVAADAPAIVPDREDDTVGASAIEGVVCLDPWSPARMFARFSVSSVHCVLQDGRRPALRRRPALTSVACLPSSVPTPQIGL